MSPEEGQLLTALFERVQAASSTPRDVEAEAVIEDQTRRQPHAAYYLAQAVIVQEKGLEFASGRIQELEARVRELESAGSDRQDRGGGFLGSIFGSSEPPRNDSIGQNRTSVPNSAFGGNGSEERGVYRPPQQSGGPLGGGFLNGALGTAAGVAGGMLLANSLSGIFGNHMSGLGWGSPVEDSTPSGSEPIEETVTNNYYGDTISGDNHQDDVDIRQADYGTDDPDDGSSDLDGSDDNLDA